MVVDHCGALAQRQVTFDKCTCQISKCQCKCFTVVAKVRRADILEKFYDLGDIGTNSSGAQTQRRTVISKQCTGT